MRETLVVDVALNTVRMFRLCEVKGKIVLMAMERLKLPLYENNEPSNEDIVDGIRCLHKKIGSKEKFINCIISGKYLLIKTERLPPARRAKLNKIIQYEIDSHLVINKEDLIHDYQLTRDEAGNKLLLVACRSDVINRETAPIEEAGLRINSIEFSPGALLNVFLYNYEPDDMLTALLNIGSEATDLVIQRGGHLNFAASIVGGFDLFINALKKKLNVPQEEAERIAEEAVISIDTEGNEISTDEVSKAATLQLDEILGNVQRYLRYWMKDTDLRDKNIKKFYLSGYGSLLPNADKYVSHFFETDTELLNPLMKISVGPEVEEGKFCPSTIATHIGAGLRELTTARININLLPKAKKKEINLTKKRGYLLLSTILTVTILFTPFLNAHLSRIYYSSRLQHVEKVLSKYEKYIPRITELSEEREAIINRIASSEELRKKNTHYLENLTYISQLFPEDIYLNNFLVKLPPDGKAEHFVLGGSCRDYNEIEEIVDTLNSSSLFTGAKVSEITDAKDKGSPDNLSFVIYLTPADSQKELQ